MSMPDALAAIAVDGARINVSFHEGVNGNPVPAPVWRIPAGSNSVSVIDLLNRAGTLLLTKASELARKCNDQENVQCGLAPWQIRHITTHIKENLGTALRVGQLARLCRLSPSYFTRMFSVSFGCPPHRFITRCRLERAKQLMLESDSRLCEIAMQCGFVDQAHFSRIFLKFSGVSPARWRRALADRELAGGYLSA